MCLPSQCLLSIVELQVDKVSCYWGGSQRRKYAPGVHSCPLCTSVVHGCLSQLVWWLWSAAVCHRWDRTTQRWKSISGAVKDEVVVKTNMVGARGRVLVTDCHSQVTVLSRIIKDLKTNERHCSTQRHLRDSAQRFDVSMMYQRSDLKAKDSQRCIPKAKDAKDTPAVFLMLILSFHQASVSSCLDEHLDNIN
jgi:hypothetical protein